MHADDGGMLGGPRIASGAGHRWDGMGYRGDIIDPQPEPAPQAPGQPVLPDEEDVDDDDTQRTAWALGGGR